MEAGEKARASAREALRVARAAAAQDPALLPRVAAAESAGDAAVAAVLAATVRRQHPANTAIGIYGGCRVSGEAHDNISFLYCTHPISYFVSSTALF